MFHPHAERLRFNLAIEMLFISGRRELLCPYAVMQCFNLAIEMLFISGKKRSIVVTENETFQSRNRDAFHIRLASRETSDAHVPTFQSRNRDAFHIRMSGLAMTKTMTTAGFQSRNRDAFHIRATPPVMSRCAFSKFQSRNRDAFHIRARRRDGWTANRRGVSISQSRCFSYQDLDLSALRNSSPRFQSRNRDAFHIRGKGENEPCAICRFNLAIEMLFISGPCPRSP